jgi:geranylgeranylglycerol-phosphate geranylgeranyltransferase
MINDVVDRGVDAINKPWKPIPRGIVNPRTVAILSIILLVAAITVNILVSIPATITALVYGIVAYTYSFMRRRWWSHFQVAFSTTAPTVYGYVLAGMPPEYMNLAILFSATIFTATLGRELVKALMDMEGDRRMGYSTIPLKYGVEKTSKAILVLGVTAPILGYMTGILAGTGILYYILITITSILYTYYMLKAYKKPVDKNVLEDARRNTLKAMMIGLLAFLLSKTSV